MSEKNLRLALLLSGAGIKGRRYCARAGTGGDFEKNLKDAGIPPALLSLVRSQLDSAVPALLERVMKAGWRWVGPGDSEYPEILTTCADPPLGLFIRGSLSMKPRCAIVGSRKATPYGLQVARLLGERIGAAGGVVISGMARGIDAEAHEGALSSGGETWAIFGTGPDRIYPSEHADLAMRISRSGALITEFPPGTPPRPHHFLQRNRIVAVLAAQTVVVEASARSGALSTARQAIDEGREVFAVPGSIFSEASVGPNGLLRAGATPLAAPTDLLAAMGLKTVGPEEGPHPLDGILRPGECLQVDQLARRMDRPISHVLSYLLQLEIEGWVFQAPDGGYLRAKP